MNFIRLLTGFLLMGFLTFLMNGTIEAAPHEHSEALHEIKIQDIEGVHIGNAQDNAAKTGVTAMIFPQGAQAGVDISGGGPASRETPVLSPTTNPTPLNALVLSGGSAYGLAAADGVMQYLEEHNIGFNTGFALVPIVCQSDIYDLSYGSNKIRPDSKMGYAACEDAMYNNNPRMGSVGAGTGATVGKLYGMKQSEKSGLGIYAVQMGNIKIAAVVTVNALGDIYDAESGQKLAGLKTPDRKAFLDSSQEMYRAGAKIKSDRTNTTIGAIITNASFDKTQLTKIASMTRNAYARCIRPVGTLADGDTIYAVSVGDQKADLNTIGTLAADVMSEAIKRAVESSAMDDTDYLANCRSIGK